MEDSNDDKWENDVFCLDHFKSKLLSFSVIVVHLYNWFIEKPNLNKFDINVDDQLSHMISIAASGI